MTRVEWLALGGDEVETLLANLIYNHDGRAVRIRPSQGDYGIDIVIPAAADATKWDVYQVKKYARNLTPGQKTKIVESFGRVLVGMLRRNVPLNDWYLVLPLDPTLENYLDWLQEVPELAIEKLQKDKKLDPQLSDDEVEQIRTWLAVPDRIIGWKGLPFCESLVADYPYVVDYYLHGGRERLREAVSDVARLLRRDSSVREFDEAETSSEEKTALLEPGEITEHFARLDRVLDTDPHYRYDYSIDSRPPDPMFEPGLVAAKQLRIRDDRWLTFKIYARSAQSLEERPIPLKLTLQFEPDSASHESFKDWLKYGKPFEGDATVESDLPGGLGTEHLAGRVVMMPDEGEEQRFHNRQQIVGPDRSVLAEVRYTLTSSSGPQRTGIRAHGQDESGLLEVESLFDVESQYGTMNYTLKPLAGVVASRALPAITFARHLCAPNILRIAGEYGPLEDQLELTGPGTIVTEDVADVVRDLAIIQGQTSVPVVIPNFLEESYTIEDIKEIRRAALLIEGHTVIQEWSAFEIPKFPHVEVVPGTHCYVQAGQYLRLRKITGDVVLGRVQQLVTSATIASVQGDLVRIVPYKENTMYLTMVDRLPEAPAGSVAVLFAEIPDEEESIDPRDSA
jgi:hypothetical protein